MTRTRGTNGGRTRPPLWVRNLMNGWFDEALRRQGHRCHYCGVHLFKSAIPDELRFNPSMDHIIPLSKGGRHEEENIVAACWLCNNQKRSMWPEDFVWWLIEHQPDRADFIITPDRKAWLKAVEAQHEGVEADDRPGD